MGIATISIILFHFSNECRSANINYYPWNEFILNYISSSGVDIFLILSGYGLYYSFKKNNNIKEFYNKRLKKIIIPYITFCLPSIILRYSILNKGSLLDVFSNLFFVTLFTIGETWFWYILLIIICYLLFPKIYDILDSPKEDIDKEMNLISLITFAILLNFILATNAYSLFKNINILTLRIPIFILGVYIGQKSSKNEELSFLKILFMIICAILFYQVINSNMMLRRYEFALIGMLTYIILIMIFEKIEKYKLFNIIKLILEKIGSYSLELYITHVCIISILNILGFTTAIYKYFALEILFIIIASVIIKKLTDIISNKIKKIGW